jgi:hypothetical protein
MNGISVFKFSQLVAEVDHTTVKLLEFLRRRQLDNETKSFPLLPLILLLPPDTEAEATAAATASGAADYVLRQPFTAKEVFECIVQAVSRIHAVQHIYADIHKFKESKKFVHLPIFDDNPVDDESSVMSLQSMNSILSRVQEDSDEEEAEMQSQVSEIEEWEDTNDVVVPQFVTEMRNSKQFQKHNMGIDRMLEAKDRAQIDSSITKFLRNGSKYVYFEVE